MLAGISSELVDRILLRDRVRNVDGEEFRLAARSRRCRDRIDRDLALERADRHEGVDRRIARHLANLAGGELADRDLVGIDAELFQDYAQQRDIGLRTPDHADAAAGKFVETLDLGGRLFLRAFGGKAGRRPQHNDILAQDGDRLCVLGQVQIAARNREIGLAGGEQRDAFRCSFRRDQRQPHRAVFTRKGLRHELDQFLVFAVCRPDRDPKRGWPQHVIQPAGSGGEREQAGGQNQKRIAPLLPPSAGSRSAVVRV